MKRRVLKVLSFLLITFILLSCCSSIISVYAAGFDYSKVYSANISKGNDAEGDINDILSAVLTVIRYAGSGIAVIMLTVIILI